MICSNSLSRRGFLATAAALALPISSGNAASSRDLIQGITRETLWKNRDGNSITWFHPRACLVPRPSADPLVLMTLQQISGSDYFGPVHWTSTEDQGKTWTDPVEIEGFGRKPVEGHAGLEEGVCDVVPQYHPQTDTTLALGHCVFYRGPKFSRGDQLSRFPMYCVRSADGTWSDRKKLLWNDPRGSHIYTNNCGQRVVLPNGDILLAFTFGAGESHRMVAGVRCGFDGETLTVREVGPPLENKVKRGLLEPSMTEFQGRYYLTIRAEDDRGYVSVSDDGLNWEAKQAWSFDDGELLTMSTTQQHWMTHADALYLVYNRRAANNTGVMRWRSPLFICQVDPKRRVLLKETERVALPLVGDGVNAPNEVALMGNFHVVNASPSESWITVGEWLPKHGARGNTLLARVAWSRPNGALAKLK
ncbi:exo-alpha-sialidase [Bremerella cremea]|uniref:Exo-alpha-sialidase n=1 Tax=Blastopirellula marina TaxID=124 RepID=A0A2S8FIB4_9BACT|nr:MULTISPECIES: sialidase family protein [Pirellulaceae]PQO31902.1 exo-alpha-sialidase [Blastopirellula marina]RCS44968.1 exo-alpha-sialidase [Bremerella cremea]